MSLSIQEFSKELFKIGSIQFGEYILKSGIVSPFYLDLRLIISHPKLLKQLAKTIDSVVDNNTYDVICGVPYAGIVFATALSLETHKPMIMKRKEQKSYGTKKILEGDYQKDNKCLIIEDVISSGQSVLETLPSIENEGLIITEVVVLIDREQGGTQILTQQGYSIKALFSIKDILVSLCQQNLISKASFKQSISFIENNNFIPKTEVASEKEEHLVLKTLKKISKQKKSNLILSLDKVNPAEVFEIIDKVGDNICMLKLHTDTWNYFNDTVIEHLIRLKNKHNFLILEDRKFADIGKTMQDQVQSQIYKMPLWADVFTCHTISGLASVQALAKSIGTEKALILIGNMSCEGTLTDQNYLNQSIEIGKKTSQVIGLVSQLNIQQNHLFQFTPGIKLSKSTDGLGQQYNTPEDIFLSQGADFAIVGRGIIEASNIVETAKEYQSICWKFHSTKIF